MDVSTTSCNNHRTSSVIEELYFLIARFLEAGPCQNAAETLKRELAEQGLLPKRIDWLGNDREQNYEQVALKFQHVQSDHLLQICRRLGPLVEKEVPSNSQGVVTLLGTGRHSLLRKPEDLLKIRSHFAQYIVRQNFRPRSKPHNIPQANSAVYTLLSRELTGSIDKHNIAATKQYNRLQLFCRTLGHLSAVYCVLFDRTGQYIFTGADDLLIKIWSATTGRLLSTLRGASAEIADLAVSFDNTLLAAGSCDKIVRVWCLRTTAPIAVLTGHGGIITNIQFCPADRGPVKYLASTSSDGSVSFWEYIVEDGKTAKFFPKPHKFNERMRPGQAQMLCASFSPGGMFLAAGCADHHVRVYAMFGQEGPERILEIEAHTDRVNAIQWANSGLRFVSGSKDGLALLWRYEKQEWRTIRLNVNAKTDGQPETPDAQKHRVNMVTWSLDDRWIITAVSDFSLKIWDSTTGVLKLELKGHEGEVFVLEPHPFDPDIMLSAGHDGRVIIWDISKGEIIKSFLNFIEGQGHGAMFDAKWSPSGYSIAATDSHGHVCIYGIGGNERFKILPKAMFFHTDYRPLIRDAHHHVLDEQTQLAPHLMPPPFLVDSDGNPYPPALQRLVPGREQLKDDQLVPMVVVNNSGEQEIIEAPVDAANAVAAVAAQPQPPRPTRSNIDQMIEELAQQQERQRNRPRPNSSSASSAAPLVQEHSYASRSRVLMSGSSPTRASSAELPAQNNESPATTPTPGQAQEEQESTEATATETLPGFCRRVVVKPISASQLDTSSKERQAMADEEVALFFEEIQRKSPDLAAKASSSTLKATALLLGRSQGIGDAGWSPSRPRRRPQDGAVSSPARSRRPPSSPAVRSNRQNRERSRSSRVEGRRRNEQRSRIVVRDSSSEPEAEARAETRRTERRSRRGLDQEEEERSSGEEREQSRQTRSQTRRRRLSTSSEESADSELGSAILDDSSSESDSPSFSDSSSSDYSDWTAEAGINLEPPKRNRRKVYQRPRYLSSDDEGGTAANSPNAAASAAAGTSNANDEEAEETSQPPPPPRKKKYPIPRSGAGGFDRIPESFRPSEWLSEVVPRRTPYYPQMGDEIVYFRQGHELYLDAVKQKKVYEFNEKSLPWGKNVEINQQELVKVIGIKYEIKPPRLCCLKLGRIDARTGALTGESFTIKYHDMADVLDFLVLRQAYETAAQRNWKPNDRFRTIIDDLWWEGQVDAQEPFNNEAPDSMFLCYRIRWDNGESDRMGPWDLEPIDTDRRPSHPGAGVPVLPEEIAATLYQPRAEDWPPGGDRDAECQRIAEGLNQVMSLAIAEPFVAPVDLNMYPSYAYIVEYPIDLSTIKARLENRFYRRVTAVQYDVRYIYTNACKFNEAGSTIVKNAAIITDLCLDIIRNQDAVDITASYHQLVEKYRDQNEAGPSTALPSAKKSSGRLRSRKSSPQSPKKESDSVSEEEKRNKEERIKTRMAAAAALHWKQQCRELVDVLWRCDDAVPFREPVNLLEHPDYEQIIDHPMDLLTVREQLQVDNYESPQEFAKDVRLIFENSKNYNTNKKSRIYAMTVRLAAAFEEHIRPILQAYRTQKDIIQQSGTSKTKRKSEANNTQASRSKGKSVASKDKKGKSLKSTTSNGDSKPRLKIVLSRKNSSEMVVASSSASNGVASAKRRILDDNDSSSSTAESEDDDAKPGPSGLNSRSSETTNGTPRKSVKRRIMTSDDEEDEDEEEEEAEVEDRKKPKTNGKKGKMEKESDDESESSDSSDSSYSASDSDQSGKRKKRAAPPKKRLKAAEESNEELESEEDDEEQADRPSCSSSASGSLANGGENLRRSQRVRRRPKRPLDSEISEDGDSADEGDRLNPRVRTRNAGKRTVRYREDSGEESRRRKSGGRRQEDDDESSSRRKNRKSARDASRKVHDAAENGESDAGSDDRPTPSVSSRGRVRKPTRAAQGLFE